MDEYRIHTAIIIVTDTEEQGLRAVIGGWEELSVPGDGQQYYKTSFVRDGTEHTVIYARQNEMGMTGAAMLSSKLIENFRPKYLIMCGIAAGVGEESSENQMYGDVVVADMIWNYACGKFVPADRAEIRFGNVGYISRPTYIHALEGIREYVDAAIASPENQTKVHIGPMACGNTVVASQEIVQKQVKSQHGETQALDMESYAVAYAARHCAEPRPEPVIIKSICDFANSQKDDRFQRFAAYTSAEFAKLLYEKFLP